MKEKGFCLLAEIIIININDKRSMLENLVKKKNPGNIGHDEAV